MYIVLDTNVFFNNWHLRGAEFARLIKHANDVAATILVSQVVVDEANAKYREHLSELRSGLIGLISKAQHLLPDRSFEWPKVDVDEPYNLLVILKEKFHSVECASYEKVGHQRLVKKAIYSERPFQKSEKGYRDALLWLTILDFLDENRSDRHVAFVTDNKNDFFSDGKDEEAEFHAHLMADWGDKRLENKLFPYRRLAQFNDKQQAPIDYVVDIEAFSEENLELIEEGFSTSVREYLEGQGTIELLRLLCLPNMVVESSNWEIVEDFEDTELIQVIPLSDSLSYVLCRFNLRAVYVSLSVALDVYNAHKRDVDITFQRITSDGDFVELQIGLRCYLRATALINTKTHDISEIDFDVDEFRS
jgi:hypothetical protein